MRIRSIGASLCAALAMVASPAGALDGAPASSHTWSANVALTTDYLFRGISQTDDGPALQGGFDYAYEPLGVYAGAWASNVELLPFGSPVRDRSSLELDFYGGFAGSFTNGTGWDIGGIYYYYPQQHEDAGPVGDYDYAEVYGALSHSFATTLSPSLEAGAAYSPDYFGEDGDGVYAHGTLGVTLPYAVGLAVTVGYLDVDGDKTTGALGGYDYVHYKIGLSKSFGIFTADLSWNDTDDGCDDLYAGDDDLCNGVVFSVSSSF